MDKACMPKQWKSNLEICDVMADSSMQLQILYIFVQMSVSEFMVTYQSNEIPMKINLYFSQNEKCGNIYKLLAILLQFMLVNLK